MATTAGEGEKRTKVGILVERQIGYCEGVLRGIWRHAIEANWVCRGAELRPDCIERLSAWSADGVITGLWDPQTSAAVLALGLPTVDVFRWFQGDDVVRAGIDDVKVGRLAAEHLLERRLKSLAFVGETQWIFANERLTGFEQVLAEAGLTCRVYGGQVPSSSWELLGIPAETDPRLVAWLRELPAPAGVFCANDDIGLQVIDTCQNAGLRVPEEVAVLGVDDNPFLCHLAHPPMSSIKLGSDRVGYAAARLLEQMMGGEARPASVLLPPIGVMERQSTDVLALDDPDLAEAVRWLRRNATKPINIGDLLGQVPLSRRTLEMRFAEYLGCSPREELERVRVAHAQHLLANTDLPIAEVAGRSGFAHGERLANVFRARTKTTPSAYRKAHRL